MKILVINTGSSSIKYQLFEMDLPAKVKIGVLGCPLCCGESFVRDIGLLGKKNGWTLIVGGSSARRPRIGDVLTEDLSKDGVIDLTRRCLEYYKEKAKKRERMARAIEELFGKKIHKGIINVKYGFIEDQEGLDGRTTPG